MFHSCSEERGKIAWRKLRHASPCPTKIIASSRHVARSQGSRNVRRTFERSIRSVIATLHAWEGLETGGKKWEEWFRAATDSSADLRSVRRAITLGWFNDRLSIGKSFARPALFARQAISWRGRWSRSPITDGSTTRRGEFTRSQVRASDVDRCLPIWVTGSIEIGGWRCERSERGWRRSFFFKS